VAVASLKPGGCFVGKLFFSDRHGEMTKALRPHFGDVRTMRPRATRSASKEVFVVGLRFGQTQGGDATVRRAQRGPRGSRPPRG
jgi:23S rRNA U2552 (ribose-2'-O)-methylase RlmE/FtsJ